jgi:hypothetical protein
MTHLILPLVFAMTLPNRYLMDISWINELSQPQWELEENRLRDMSFDLGVLDADNCSSSHHAMPGLL